MIIGRILSLAFLNQLAKCFSDARYQTVFPDDSFFVEETEEGEEEKDFWEALGGKDSQRTKAKGWFGLLSVGHLCVLSVCLSVCLSACLLVYLPVARLYLSIYLSVCLSVCHYNLSLITFHISTLSQFLYFPQRKCQVITRCACSNSVVQVARLKPKKC